MKCVTIFALLSFVVICKISQSRSFACLHLWLRNGESYNNRRIQVLTHAMRIQTSKINNKQMLLIERKTHLLSLCVLYMQIISINFEAHIRRKEAFWTKKNWRRRRTITSTKYHRASRSRRDSFRDWASRNWELHVVVCVAVASPREISRKACIRDSVLLPLHRARGFSFPRERFTEYVYRYRYMTTVLFFLFFFVDSI